MSRYRNVTILVALLFVQVLGLAVQVKRRSGADESTRIIRLWTVSAVTPLEKAIVWCQNGLGNMWSNYIYLRGVRQENRDLKFEIEQLRLEQVRLSDDAQQARRLHRARHWTGFSTRPSMNPARRGRRISGRGAFATSAASASTSTAATCRPR